MVFTLLKRDECDGTDGFKVNTNVIKDFNMRLITIDILKIASIFLVIMSHVTLFFLLNSPSDVFLYLFRQSGQLGVTVFFMCSGFFLLNNKKDE